MGGYGDTWYSRGSIHAQYSRRRPEAPAARAAARLMMVALREEGRDKYKKVVSENGEHEVL